MSKEVRADKLTHRLVNQVVALRDSATSLQCTDEDAIESSPVFWLRALRDAETAGVTLTNSCWAAVVMRQAITF